MYVCVRVYILPYNIHLKEWDETQSCTILHLAIWLTELSLVMWLTYLSVVC